MPNLKKDHIDMVKTSIVVKKIINKKGLKVEDIEKKLSSSQPIENWFNGTYMPSIEDFQELSNILGVPMEQWIIQKDETNKTIISERDLPPEDFKRMGDLALRYNIPFHDLIDVYTRGFKFYEASALFDEEVENKYLN